MGLETCPFCNAGLQSQEVADGWCETCGKKLPSAVTGKPAGLSALTRYPDTEREDRWSYDDRSFSRKPLASRGARLGGALIDGFLAAVMYIPYAIGVGMMDAHNSGDRDVATLMILASVFLLLLFGIVQIVLLCTSGQTIGKKVVGTRIVLADDGRQAGFVNAWLLRALVPGLIGVIPCVGPIFSLVDVCYIFNEDRRCLHDLIAKTIVVEA
jgi:uncharacterized RDD family membrane protein YckC